MIAAASIVSTQLAAAALFVLGASLGCGPGMNACWVAAFALMYLPIRSAMQAPLARRAA